MDGKMISHKKVSIFLSDKYTKNITEQMIKYYWNGTVKLFENEFIDNSKFIEYLNLIEK